MKPLYMWAGGKTRLIPKYIQSPGIPTEGFSTFVEPFFGAGAMTIWIYNNCPNVKRFIINDIKKEIIDIYAEIQNNRKAFTDILDDLQDVYLSKEKKQDKKELFYQIRTLYATNTHSWNKTEETATLYFLMKTAFNGVWQTSKRANGRFDTPFGLGNQKDKIYDKDNVIKWEHFLQKAELYCGNWEDACKKVDDRAFYFFDPPYRDCFADYGGGFSDSHHIDLIKFSNRVAQNDDIVFYCNRDDHNDSFFTTHKGILKSCYYDVKYTVGRRATENDGSRSAKSAQELLLYSNNIIQGIERFID